MFNIITIGSAARDVFIFSKALHPHKTNATINQVEVSMPFGAKINIEKMIFATGGGSTNSSTTFKRLGKFKVASIARVGDDPGGHTIIKLLQKDKINTSLIQIAKDDQTSYSTILSPGGDIGERTILAYRGASNKINSEKIPWRKAKAKWYYVSSLGGDLNLLKDIIKQAKKIKAQIAFNPGGQELKQRNNLLPLLKDISILSVNREEASFLTKIPFTNTKKILSELSKISPMYIMTDGGKGAYAGNNRKEAFHIPSGGAKPKNITGAGDAFGSAFITGWIKSKGDIEESLRVGTLNANSVVQKIGAKNGILEKYPSKNQLNRLKIKRISL